MENQESRLQQERQPHDPVVWSWGRWVKRALVVAILATLVVVQWPMLKAIAYGIVPPEQVSPDQLPQWRESYEAALAESRKTGKPVLIDFTASWCPPCRVMEADVWPDEEVRAAIAERVVPLQIDVDDPHSAGVAQRYGVQMIPTILLVDGEGNEQVRGNFMSAGQMIDFINSNTSEPAVDTEAAA